jgi:hypothetical protein
MRVTEFLPHQRLPLLAGKLGQDVGDARQRRLQTRQGSL